MENYIRKLEFLRVQMKLQKVRVSIIALIVTLMGSLYFLAYVFASKDSSVGFLYKITKRDKLSVYGTAKEEAIKFIHYGTIGVVFKLLGIIAILLTIVCFVATKKRMTKLIKTLYYEWIVGYFASACFKSYSVVSGDSVDLERVNLNIDNYGFRKKIFKGTGEGYSFEQVEVNNQDGDCLGRIVKFIYSGENTLCANENISMLVYNDNINLKFADKNNLVYVDTELFNGCKLYLDAEHDFEAIDNLGLINNVTEVMTKYAGTSIYILNNEMYVLYPCSRFALLPDLSKRFSTKDDGQKIKTDIGLINDASKIMIN